ncbi:lipase (class 3) [Hydrogenoanaerobacterium saccharovorans]|uniref:Lipase (Class 3) n=1 Tax=Hydrogenoanaerobacterium saccharovorans TaxID=474960 RepID=A0A1H7Z2V3_9FIRM|nr:lipase family protein [Hydrogenoanaerobacterium saccharovorans]RPF48863.1 lipase (class 3) [Hydrogenoanaerobacterium saccharovorans]SEM52521.1 Lipase (class 3) [Hydrogenoanaerobacterium saccharovorans]
MTKKDIINMMELSALAYNSEHTELPNQQTVVIDDHATDIQCYVYIKKPHLTISFRGTDSKKDWLTDFTFWKKIIPYGNTNSKIKVHTGFINAYKSTGIRNEIHKLIPSDIHYIRVTGHSYGAALAVLCAVDLQYNFPSKDYEVFLYGCPRVGNNAFKKSYNKRVFKTLRIENGNDIVTKIPFATLGYRHVGIKLHIGKPRLLGLVSFEQHRLQSYYSHFFKRLAP